MADIDPYSALGVPRSAKREEIARAYRALAKRHHPDAGAPPSPTMSRINEAWFILSEPGRRATWDRMHGAVITPHWVPATAPAEPMRRPPPRPAVPPSRLDSGWAAAAVVGAVAVVVGIAMIALSATLGPVDARITYSGSSISLRYPDHWSLAEGEPAAAADRWVIAHVTTYPIGPEEHCTDIDQPCAVTGEAIPTGEASIVITEWRTGTPPVPDPVTERPAGLHADAIIGGAPAAFETQRTPWGLIAWWQLSPPGFPDRWIEVRAELVGASRPEDDRLGQISTVVESIEFTD